MPFVQRAKAVLDVLSAFAVVVAAGVAVWKLAFASAAWAPAMATAEDTHGVIEASEVTNVQGHGRLAIVEFSDFECPFCGEHARKTLPEIARTLVHSGRARYVVMHFPLATHPRAMQAAEVAECAARQGHFWDMHDRLFAGVEELAPDRLVDHAKALGLDVVSFNQCLERHDTLAKVRADRTIGRQLGVQGTPTFFIGIVRDDGGIEIMRLIRGVASRKVLEEQLATLSR